MARCSPERAIANGDKSFGVSFMKIEEKLDAGGIYKLFLQIIMAKIFML